MIPAELDTGPPSKMRSPSWKPGRREVSIERTTIDITPPPHSCPAPSCGWSCYVLSAEELSEWLANLCRKEGTCRRP